MLRRSLNGRALRFFRMAQVAEQMGNIAFADCRIYELSDLGPRANNCDSLTQSQSKIRQFEIPKIRQSPSVRLASRGANLASDCAGFT